MLSSIEKEMNDIAVEHEKLCKELKELDARFGPILLELPKEHENQVKAVLEYVKARWAMEYKPDSLMQRRSDVIRDLLKQYHLVPKDKKLFKLRVLQIRLEEPGIKKKKKTRLQKKMDKLNLNNEKYFIRFFSFNLRLFRTFQQSSDQVCQSILAIMTTTSLATVLRMLHRYFRIKINCKHAR